MKSVQEAVWRRERVLVTGHLGFVGSHLVRELEGRAIEYEGIDLRETLSVKRDILDCILPPSDHFDRVFHLASQVDAQCANATHDASINILGTLRLLAQYGKKVIYASTSMVNYPTTPYAISKQAAEHYVRIAGGGVIRFCNLWGDGGHSVIDKFRESEVCTIFGTGHQTRSYAPVTVAVRELLAVRPGDLKVLEGDVWTVNEIAAQSGKPIRRLPPREFDLENAIQLPLKKIEGD